MLNSNIRKIYEDASRLTQGAGAQPVAAALLVLASVLNDLPGQTFDSRIELNLGDSSNALEVALGGAKAREHVHVDMRKC